MKKTVLSTSIAFVIGLISANASFAADLNGAWTLSFPSESSAWTFVQATPQSRDFTASSTVTVGPLTYAYAINPGITVGKYVVGVETLSVQQQTGFPIGVLVANSDGETLSGVLFGLDASQTPVSGTKVVVAPSSGNRVRR
ncbi:hypothetical protein Spb1_35980 [Planctopirus ephydatiae]|jgi:hypothetical protein|uniref:Uncharacterized protein n=1 Tax=Planctopirus ephydatiae TaxID=2528019 RepID=A0A518GSU5_9PLAN|nr:hypothetical protein [Planctopirus ephydatiae]QDV31653.1 hypothetical protein Spb1_35980 [Planctopirus ephydatiae]